MERDTSLPRRQGSLYQASRETRNSSALSAPVSPMGAPVRLLLLVLAGVAIACGKPSDNDCPDCVMGHLDANCSFSEQPDWSFLIFANTWPGTFCSDGCCRLPHGIHRIEDGFTIHGLWPNFASSGFPVCCMNPFNSSMVVNMLVEDDLMHGMLQRYWPTLKKCGFLKYEYEKHGSCASTLYGPMEYFKTTLGLRMKYDFHAMLLEAGIKPSTHDDPVYYDLYKDIIPAIENRTGVRVIIGCDEEQPDWLLEVKMCFGREKRNSPRMGHPTAIDCPSDLIKTESNCQNRPHGIRIPAIPSITQRTHCPIEEIMDDSTVRIANG